MTKTIMIEGMTCNHCVMHVTNALKEIDGVSAVEVNLQKKLAVVETSSDVSDSILINAVTETGYQVLKVE